MLCVLWYCAVFYHAPFLRALPNAKKIQRNKVKHENFCSPSFFPSKIQRNKVTQENFAAQSKIQRKVLERTLLSQTPSFFQSKIQRKNDPCVIYIITI